MEVSDRDMQYASEIVDQLLRLSTEKLNIQIEENLVISDIQSSALLFSIDYQIARKFDVQLLAIEIAGNNDYLIPISFLASIYGFFPNSSYLGRETIESWWKHLGRRISSDLLYELLRALRDTNETELSPEFRRISPDDALEAFRRLATKFLATRIAAVRSFSYKETIASGIWGRPATLNLAQISGGHKVVTPGCYFSVSTNSSGLRVFWSGAYYISPNYFGHPTSPATSVLQAGTYLFGVDGGAYGGTVQWDTSAVVSLPGMPMVHLNY